MTSGFPRVSRVGEPGVPGAFHGGPVRHRVRREWVYDPASPISQGAVRTWLVLDGRRLVGREMEGFACLWAHENREREMAGHTTSVAFFPI